MIVYNRYLRKVRTFVHPFAVVCSIFIGLSVLLPHLVVADDDPMIDRNELQAYLSVEAKRGKARRLVSKILMNLSAKERDPLSFVINRPVYQIIR